MQVNDFETIVFGRKSIRQFDPEVKISHEEMLEMLNEAVKAPSAVNLQPWRFTVVESKDAKATLAPLLYGNQLQNETSAAMILIFGDRQCYDYTQEIYDTALAQGKMPQEVRDRQVSMIVPMYQAKSESQMDGTVKIDASLAAMQLMLVARAHGYDTNPITGFDASRLAQAFDLDPERYVPVMIVAIGKAAEAGHDSIRIPAQNWTSFK